MDRSEFDTGRAITLTEVIEHIAGEVVLKPIMKNPTGTICAISCDRGRALAGRVLPFDNYIQVIEGKVDIVLEGTTNIIEAGQSIVIPAHTSVIVKAIERYIIISTIIKSGYE